ncbi:MAG: rRNA pseudouridine synthase [Oscillospiraceae bacterium]|nr:rRNA pseudouridine synthase [Oscillospiraceae bacterium]
MEEMRIQKYLSECGVMSRRNAEDAVMRGRVEINGKKAVVGQKVVPEIDEVMVDGIIIGQNKNSKKIYMMMYKPAGIVTTMSDEQDRVCVADILKSAQIEERVYPVGRLDMYSEGLLILTNDGEVANKLMHPKNEISKIYHITLKGELSQDTIKKLSEPIEVDGRMTSPAKVEIIELKNGKTKLRIEISEGRNRQIRRMCENLNLIIIKLKRVCIGKLNVGTLKPGQFKYLNNNEINYLKEL